MKDLIGQTIFHYRILEKLGEGGMGIVFKAEDSKLKRPVALKFLSPELTRDEVAKNRFIQEAQAASALEHNNICNIHEINQTEDGQIFIVMAYYKGQTLKQTLEKTPVGANGCSSLQMEDILSITKQISQGLSKAHEQGIVHRDIKPANIMITTDGDVKILDFGLAKLAGKTLLTKTGTTLGTVDYMSPEQTQGLAVDFRTDIWSLGVILYEMLSGEKPFKGEFDQAVMYNIVNGEPVSISLLRPDLPRELENILEKMLEKYPENRLQNIEAFKDVITSAEKYILSGVNIIKALKKEQKDSIAVLPFSNISADAENEYFCDGLSEELINALSQVKDLRVIGRTSAFAFKGKEKDLSEIAKKLKVKTVIDGSVRKAGNRLRITAEFINVQDGYQVWSEKFDRESGDIFAIQDDIANHIVKTLKIKLGREEEKAVYQRYTNNFEAYNVYLKGKYYWNRITPDNLKKSIAYYNQAIELDPNFVLPYCGLADSYWASHQILILPSEEVMPKAKEAALAALEIDDCIAESHALVGQLKWLYDWDWIGAEKSFKTALNLNPKSLTTILWYSAMMSYSNRHEEAFNLMKTAEGIDPLNLIYLMNVVYRYYLAGIYDKAIDDCYKLLELEPMFFYVYVLIGCSFIHTKRVDKAVEELKKMNDLLGDISEIFPFLGYAYGKTGNDVEVNNCLNQLKERAKERYIPAFFYALVYAGKSDLENTFEYLEKAYQEHDTRLIWWLRDPLFVFIRSDKRYIHLARRLNFPDLI